MMKRKLNIAVITAPNMRYVNTGMTTVELAARCFLKKTVPDADVAFYSLIHPNPPGDRRWMMMDLGHVHHSAAGLDDLFEHRPIFGNLDEIFTKDLILYWGDFLQARHYIEDEGRNRISACHDISDAAALKFVYRALLQLDVPEEIQKKTIIFGSSLLYNNGADYVREEYGLAITRFVNNAKLILMRDPISAARINHLTQDFSRSHLGIDPAFFLKADDLSCLEKGQWSKELRKNDSIALFFGTRTKPPKRLLQFCRSLADRFDLKLEWIPWFPFHEILRDKKRLGAIKKHPVFDSSLLKQIENLLPRGDQYTQGDLLAALGKYSFVITDTYHLCINSWNAGTPAICFGSEKGFHNSVIKDFKKKILYEMFDANDFYFDSEALETRKGQQAVEQRVYRLLNDEAQVALVCDRVSNQANLVAAILAENIVEVLT